MKSKRLNEEKSPIELIEEAFQLLRHSSFATWGAYAVGTLPFVLFFLYFWSDMARSAFAHERLPTGVLALSGLFLWMKFCHAVFARQLVNQLCGESSVRWKFSDLCRVAAHQFILQPIGLFLLPLTLVLIVPAGWTYAFFANLTIFAANPGNDLRAVCRKAWKQTLLWPHQNHSVLFVVKFFAMFVFLNVMTALLGVPFLLKVLFGIESVFTQSPWAAMNSTMLAGAAALTFLCIDPLLKATYVLRTFYGESLQTGEDLKAELRSFAKPVHAVVLALLVGAMAFGSVSAAELEAPDSRPTAPATAIDAGELNRSIDDVIQQREYSWRLPREVLRDSNNHTKGFIEAFFEQIEKGMRAVGELIQDLINWVRSLGKGPSLPSSSGFSIANAIQGIVTLLLIALVGLIIWFIYRLWKRHELSQPIDAVPAAAVPDLTDESVGAEQLPEDGWMSLGRDLLQRGELRLALRAFYLASLAHLAERELITLAKFKSNLDYQREVQRRGHALASVPELFARNVSAFERSWYGPHEVTPELLQDFAANTERLRTAT
ncbi:MAG: DUF4129 domain-containing protein [Verrucomicrobia bacterium]|nr:DUF4129 domain-containing protein [Verrucomicrobiota bacterium]